MTLSAHNEFARTVAQAPYSVIGRNRIDIDRSQVVAYQASDKYVFALMLDGKQHLLDTTIKALMEFNPDMIEVRRGTIVDATKIEHVEHVHKHKPYRVAVQGGWILISSRRQYAKHRKHFPLRVRQSKSTNAPKG
jgi:DNA-binding LytR/AlgR family response regulator